MDFSTTSKCFWSIVALVALLLNLNLFNMLPRIQDSTDCPFPDSNILLLDSYNVKKDLELKQNGKDNPDVKEEVEKDIDYSFLSNYSIAGCIYSRRPKEADIIVVNSVWQMHSYSSGAIYIYSAFYDDRPAAGFLPTVRLLVLSGTNVEIKVIYCHVWYESILEPYVVLAIVNETGMNTYYFGTRAYREFTYTCQLQSSQPIPTHVSITTKDRCQPYSTFVTINYIPKQNPLFEFGVCVANGYGSRSLEEFVEWMELLIIYGVSEVNLYDTNYENMTEMFDYYAQRGILRVRKLTHALPWDELWYHKIRNLRTISFNDCMLRNMYRYKYLIVIDLDEMIVPRHHINYSVVLQQIDSRLNLTKRSHSYSFYNVYFLLEFPEDKTQALRTMRYRFRVKYSKRYYASKSFVDPRSCFNLFNHYCYTLLPGYSGQVVTNFAPAAIAASHHYRTCGKFYGLPCETLYKEKILDDVMLKIRTRLVQSVDAVLKLLSHNLLV